MIGTISMNSSIPLFLSKRLKWNDPFSFHISSPIWLPFFFINKRFPINYLTIRKFSSFTYNFELDNKSPNFKFQKTISTLSIEDPLTMDEIKNRILNIKRNAKELYSLGELESILEIYTQAILWLSEEVNTRDPFALDCLNKSNNDTSTLDDSINFEYRDQKVVSSIKKNKDLKNINIENNQEKTDLFSGNSSEKIHEINELKTELSLFFGNRSLIHMKLNNLSKALQDSINASSLGFWKGYYRSSVILQQMGKYQEALDQIKLIKKKFINLSKQEQDEILQLEQILEKETYTDQIIASGNEFEIQKRFETLVNDFNQGIKAPEKLISQFVYFFSKRKNISFIWRIFHFIQHSNVDVDIRVYTSIIQCIVSNVNITKKESISKVKEVLQQMEIKHIPLNDVGRIQLLRYVIPFCDKDDIEGFEILTAEGLLSSMEQSGFTTLSFVEVLAFLDLEKTIKSSVMKTVLSKLNVPPDSRLFTSLVIQTKDINTALDIHNFMLKEYNVDYSVPFYNALLNRLTNSKDKRTLAIYRAMRRNNLLPDAYTYRILLRDAHQFNNITLYESVMKELEARNMTINDLKLTFHKKSSSDQIQRSERKQFVKAKQSYTVEHTENSTIIEKRVIGYEDISKKKKIDDKILGKIGHRF